MPGCGKRPAQSGRESRFAGQRFRWLRPQNYLIAVVLVYRKCISPLIPPVCRFYPTCSAYALEALKTRGAFTGSALTIWRLLRCQPFCKGGYDPVPPPKCRAEFKGAAAKAAGTKKRGQGK